MENKKVQTYNDGILSIYSISNIATKGNKPKEGLTLKVSPLRYEEQKVGITRFYTALQDNSKIDQLLRTPRLDFVKRGDAAIPIDGYQYKIVQIQYPKDVVPPSMDLSLERLEAAYDIT